jgi:multidrug efflux pump subunit AcrA (membrane-fusion protein)
MTRNRLMMTGAAILVVAVVAAMVLLRRGKADAEADPTPTAVVTLAALKTQSVQDVVSVYGVVQADPAGSVTVAAPKASIVARMLVRSGQSVTAGQPLVELGNAPGAELAYKQAADGANYAQTDLARVQRLYDERLAASDQLNAARKVLADAQATLTAQQKQGAGHAMQVITAPQAAVVTTVSAAAGDHVAQDAPLLVLARVDGAVVKLGLEPTGRFVAGQPVTLHPVFGGPAIASKITMVGRAADEATKTLDAIVPLNGAVVPIGAAVRGDVTTGVHAGLVAPRAAVVFDETGPHVFTVSGGKAHRLFVTVGLDQGDDIEIAGKIPAGEGSRPMNLAQIVSRRRRSLLTLLAMLIAAGVASAMLMPVSLFPTVLFPRVAVTIDAGDRPPDQMEAVITRPVEQAVRAIPGVQNLRSTTSRGSAELSVNFAWGSNMDLALQRVEAALTRAQATLPSGVVFDVRRMDPTVFPVAAYSLTSRSATPVELRRFADRTLSPALSTINGVARVNAQGGAAGEYRIETDPAKLWAYGLSPGDVATAISGANVLAASGRIEDQGKLLLALTDSRLTDPRQIGEVVVKTAMWPR